MHALGSVYPVNGELKFYFSEEDWRNKLKATLSTDVEPNTLISVLSENPKLKAAYGKDAGVSEGYTVGQHTLMVLETAQRYRDTYADKVEKTIPWNEFLFFLALHDIGKGIAKENESESFGTSISFKNGELNCTRALIKEIMGPLGIKDNKIAIFCEMLAYDTQGLYLKEHIHQAEAFDNILEMSRNCGLEPLAFYELFEAYHAFDAASYPDVFRSIFEVRDGKLRHNESNQNKIDCLRQIIASSSEGEQLLQELSKKIKTGSPRDVQEFFLNNLPQLHNYLSKMHKEMLSLSKDVSPEKREQYQSIKRAFRDLFICLATSSTDIESLHQEYANSVSHLFGRNDFDPYSKNILERLTTLFVKGRISEEKQEEIEAFVDELMNFRKDFLCRYSIAKVERAITQQREVMQSGSFAPSSERDKELTGKVLHENIHFSEFALSLLGITFTHGSNSAILPNLLKTAWQIMPSYRLMLSGIIPFSGELGEGSADKGVNRYRISGTSLDDGTRAIRYATSQNFQVKPPNEEQNIIDFLEIYEKKICNKEVIFKLNGRLHSAATGHD